MEDPLMCDLPRGSAVCAKIRQGQGSEGRGGGARRGREQKHLTVVRQRPQGPAAWRLSSCAAPYLRVRLCMCAVVSYSLRPVDSSPPGSSVHRTFQARILEWVAMPFSKGSSQPRDRTHVSCLGKWALYHHLGSPG